MRCGLCKKIGGGRIAALEVLIVASAASNLDKPGFEGLLKRAGIDTKFVMSGVPA